MRRWTHTIDGIRCPACAHPAQRVTFEAVYAWGYTDGSSAPVRRECAAGCGWAALEARTA
jgi:hypothetical protein